MAKKTKLIMADAKAEARRRLRQELHKLNTHAFTLIGRCPKDRIGLLIKGRLQEAWRAAYAASNAAHLWDTHPPRT